MLPNVLRRKQDNFPTVWDEFFNTDFLPGFFNDNWNRETRQNIPAVNVEETNKEYKIEVAAPGLDKKDFNIKAENNVLTISSEKEVKNEEKKEGYLRREFSYGTFSRSFNLPEGTEVEKIAATHKNGVLLVTIPKSAVVEKSKEIKIS